MMKRSEVQVLRRAGHSQVEVAALTGVPTRTTRRIEGAQEVVDVDTDAARFAYLTGWRKGQLAKLRWEHVDRANGLLQVPGSLTKNRRPHTIALAGELLALVERRWARREVQRPKDPVFLSPFVFHRGDGKVLGDFRKAWTKACAAASVAALLFDDLRRSGVRNLIRAGVDRDVARKIRGHKTEAMFSRDNISDTRDQVEAFDRVGHYLAERRRQPASVASIGGRP